MLPVPVVENGLGLATAYLPWLLLMMIGMHRETVRWRGPVTASHCPSTQCFTSAVPTVPRFPAFPKAPPKPVLYVRTYGPAPRLQTDEYIHTYPLLPSTGTGGAAPRLTPDTKFNYHMHTIYTPHFPPLKCFHLPPRPLLPAQFSRRTNGPHFHPFTSNST